MTLDKTSIDEDEEIYHKTCNQLFYFDSLCPSCLVNKFNSTKVLICRKWFIWCKIGNIATIEYESIVGQNNYQHTNNNQQPCPRRGYNWYMPNLLTVASSSQQLSGVAGPVSMGPSCGADQVRIHPAVRWDFIFSTMEKTKYHLKI